MAGNGQFDTPNLGQRVQRQLQFVYRFATERHATDALGRPYSAEYLANRGTQYRGSAYAAWFEGNESVSQGDGWVSEYRARDDNRTCSPCTVAQGFIIWDNKRYTYRQVRWTPKQCEQANITANRLGGDWDFDELANWDMSDLLSWGFEESDFPFDVKPLTEEGKDTEPEISRADELLAKWKVKPGDMFALGEHRLICGDCTDRAVVERVMGGDLPSLLVTSPPYGVGKDYEQGGVEEWLRTIQGCFTVAGNHVLLWFVNLGNKRTGGEGFETSNFSMMESEFLKLGFKMVSLRIWSKDPAWAGQNPYWLQTYKPVDDFEFLGTFAKSKPKHKKRLTDDEYKQWGWRGIWEFPSVHSNEIHSAMFPLELPTRAIKLYTDESSAIYEPFSGSGTTIIASQNLNRKCRAVEISPAYCAVAIERFHQHTGIEPVLLP